MKSLTIGHVLNRYPFRVARRMILASFRRKFKEWMDRPRIKIKQRAR